MGPLLAIAEWFASDQAYDRFRTHGRPLRYPELKDVGLRVNLIENNQKLQDAVLSVFHANEITFSSGNAIKIVENHIGRRKVNLQQNFLVGPDIQPTPPSPPAPGNRKDRRAAEAIERSRR